MGKILFADDEESIRMLYKEEFEDRGHEVVLAGSGEEALKKYAETSPDILVIDIKMPGMDGIELLQRIREHSRDIPVILCTAYGEYKQNLETWASDDYVVKSANIEGLLQKVENLLAKRTQGA
jgi:two-component system, response regulator, stage 0 sporulation protein F